MPKPAGHHVSTEGMSTALVLADSPADPLGTMAYQRIQERAFEAYGIAHHYAVHDGADAEHASRTALDAALGAAARGFAAAAVHRILERLALELTEDQAELLGGWAADLDLEVVEDIAGANGDQWPAEPQP
ncbi:hypothetical protein EAO70_35495 [Streptomyces sp. adm13(2018)]|uniref:hypothetical protein n=1 Tax=Streptomyces sp. adm13(2018) TaxID=2479007 RepID=UPI0011CE41A9|nr:hypothetical protein [Streptomyces sp. adm13(2018)]TXS08095.1 hypothetical protein EAO70_35495 [Streptomyces sp. adm13(2018)]